MTELNNSQTEAVLHGQGPLLVLAGPGSGKTTVITRRALNLIEHEGVAPDRILVITFTKAAAMEMRTRFFDYPVGAGASGITFSTFHALFFSVLKAAYGYTGSNILRPDVKQLMFYEIMDELKFEVEDEKDFCEKLMSQISLVKGEGMSVEHYYPMNCPKEIFEKAYRLYEEKLVRKNLIDFDDMQLLCYELFNARPDILKRWQEKYQYILVDEVQDSNLCQYKLLKMLALPQNNLMMVGDDDQSVYRFRGARPEIMLNFNRDFPDGRTIILDVNYRSSPMIVKMANRLIKNNTVRYEKKLTAFSDKQYQAVTMTAYDDVRKQNFAVYDEIRRLHAQGVPYGEIAVLFRTNLQPRSFVELLLKNNLPFSMRDVLPNIYEHWVMRDIKAYLDMAHFGVNTRDLIKIINRPKRYIARAAVSAGLEELLEFYADKDYVVERINKLSADLNMLKDMKPYAAVHYIRHVIGYDEFVEEYAQYRNMKAEEIFDVLDEIEESALDFKTYEQWLEGIEEFKKKLMLQNEKRERRSTEQVNLMTYHSSKGLEFEHVFLIDVNDGLTPYKKATTSEEIEEERRMFYVAFTRAKSYVHISWCINRYNKRCDVSPYVGELMVNREDFALGTRVYHEVYKEGVIKAIDGQKLKVRFDAQVKERTLDLNFCIQNRILRPVE